MIIRTVEKQSPERRLDLKTQFKSREGKMITTTYAGLNRVMINN